MNDLPENAKTATPTGTIPSIFIVIAILLLSYWILGGVGLFIAVAFFAFAIIRIKAFVG